MANYTKATDFASKDALLTGDPNKIVKGAEIDDEFANIQTAVNSKADLLSPTLTGTPLAPTATFGTNTTQIATTAFVQAALSALYPVGTIYTSTVATNPAATFGFGTWEAFGAGKVLVGQDAADASFDTLGETGGSKDAIVVEHTHTITATGSTAGAGGHLHSISGSTTSAGDHTHPIIENGGHTHDLQMYTSGDDNPWGGNEYISTSKSEVSGPYTPLRLTMGTAGTHTHSMSSAGSHTHTYTGSTSSVEDHTHTVSVTATAASTGSSGTDANLQPYVVVKMWKRTA